MSGSVSEGKKSLGDRGSWAEGSVPRKGTYEKVHVDVLDWEPFFQWFIFGMDSEGGQSRGKGYVQSRGNGWWATERVTPSPDSETFSIGDDEMFMDLSVVQDQRFIMLCVSVFIAQVIVACFFLRKHASHEAAPGKEKKER